MEKKSDKTKKQRKSVEYRTSVDEKLQEKKDSVKEYLVINNRNWGKMSAMMLAAQTHDRHIISHDLCWRVIRKVWRNGKIRQQARISSILIASSDVRPWRNSETVFGKWASQRNVT